MAGRFANWSLASPPLTVKLFGASPATVHGNHTRLVAAIKEVGTQLRLHARLQLQQLISVARVQRKLHHFAIGNYGPHLRARSLHHRRLRLRRHHLCQRAEFRPTFTSATWPIWTSNPFAGILESFRLHHHCVAAHGKRGDNITTIGTGFRGAAEVCLHQSGRQSAHRERPRPWGRRQCREGCPWSAPKGCNRRQASE